MAAELEQIICGRVASLHLHPLKGGAALKDVKTIEVIAGKGIEGDTRYFERVSQSSGKPSRRQVSLMAREEIAGHAQILGMESISPGTVRANIETSGIDLVALVGCRVMIGEAILCFYEPRTPCYKMDKICEGLQEQMKESRQGVLAEVVQSGRICVGDRIELDGDNSARHLSG
jgi:MOSC domain-containing protein YiiM